MSPYLCEHLLKEEFQPLLWCMKVKIAGSNIAGWGVKVVYRLGHWGHS